VTGGLVGPGALARNDAAAPVIAAFVRVSGECERPNASSRCRSRRSWLFRLGAVPLE